MDLTDRISQLPEEIIVAILSLLKIKVAARTSALSSRWKDLWMYITALDFDARSSLWDCQMHVSMELLEFRRSKYVSWVNQVLNSHKGTTIEEFKIYFDLDISFKSDIDNWINFLIQKKVQRLEVSLRRLYDNSKEGRYPFPSHSLVLSSLKTLTSLRLNCVDVSEEILQYFLSNCLFLEELKVVDSMCVVNLKISCPSLKLKNLEIAYCRDLESIEVSEINLVSFKYYGPKICLLLKNVPRLTEVSFGGLYSDYVIYRFQQFSSHVIQLEKLVLHLSLKVFHNFRKFPQLKNLKQLELTVDTCDSQSILPCFSLLKASPLLYRFLLKFMWREFPVRRCREMVQIAKKCPLKCLKVVELVSFAGCATDVEFALHLFENATSLEKITIDTCHWYAMGTPLGYVEDEDWDFVGYEGIQAAKAIAEQLRSTLPPGAEFVLR